MLGFQHLCEFALGQIFLLFFKFSKLLGTPDWLWTDTPDTKGVTWVNREVTSKQWPIMFKMGK
jgi:hypothetical protein